MELVGMKCNTNRGCLAICIELFAVHAGWKGKILLRAWGVLIAASTLFTHQHHLLDAVTGYLLALAVVEFVSRLPLRTRAGAS
jgi:membrane-associated phospholipid phosphatase